MWNIHSGRLYHTVKPVTGVEVLLGSNLTEKIRLEADVKLFTTSPGVMKPALQSRVVLLTSPNQLVTNTESPLYKIYGVQSTS